MSGFKQAPKILESNNLPVKAFQQQAKVALHKKGALGLRASVAWVSDISTSTTFAQNRFYEVDPRTKASLMGAVAKRVLAVSLNFDDDGKIPGYVFNTGCQYVGDVTADNVDTFIDQKVRPIVGGGTSYAPIVYKLLEDLKPNKEGDPAVVYVATDGDCGDKDEARKAMIEASKYPVFWVFLGVYNETPDSFTFLRELDDMRVGPGGRVVDNAAFVLMNLINVSDEELMGHLIEEFTGYPEKARKEGLLPWNASNVYKKKGWSLF